MGGGDDELERWELLHGAAAAAAAWAAQQQRLPPPRLQGLTEKSVECWVLKFSVVTLGMGNPRPSFGKKSELVVCVVQRRSFFLVTFPACYPAGQHERTDGMQGRCTTTAMGERGGRI